MRLGFDLSLQQTQKLIMTPELRQAIQLLQFNSQELWEHIAQQMEVNPMIELDSKSVYETPKDYKEQMEKHDQIDWKEYIGQYDDISYRHSSYKKDNDYSFENFVTKERTLKDHLLLQLDLGIFNSEDKVVGEYIIESIDENGYFKGSIEQLVKQVNRCREDVERVLEVIQTFDPVGVGARDLQECLRIQLREENILDWDIYEVIDKHLMLLGQNKISKIAKILGVSLKRVQWISDLIKSLEPKPGRGFASANDDVKYVTPDVVLEEVDGEYIIIVNDVAAPRLTINKYYKEMLTQEKDTDTSKFINNKLNSAMWLIKSIEQRRMTIYKVVKSLLKFQKDFFERGKMALKPLTLKDVAEDIDMHESTVSRATNGKYIQTSRGTFELKFFFSSGVDSQSGGMASTSVKTLIKDLIDGEDSVHPLSDQAIANALKEKNIKISRRTVAKYRDELNIPSSTGRRRF